MSSVVELSIRVGGKPLHIYKDSDADSFVEGRKGSEYTLHLKNKTRDRVLAVLSVDGLSIMDGKLATPDSRGYILDSFGSMEIPGWTLDLKTVAKFKFGDKDHSYAALGETQDTANSGTIGMLVYSEKVKPVPYVIHQYLSHDTYDEVRPRGPYWSKSPVYQNVNLVGSSVGSAGGSASPLRAVSNLVMGQGQGMSSAVASAGPQSSITDAVYGSSKGISFNSEQPATSNNLGTEFGAESTFKTNSVSFSRGYNIQTTTIYYDDARGLKLRGIEVIKNPQIPAPKGNPFPGVGCKPPANWRG